MKAAGAQSQVLIYQAIWLMSIMARCLDCMLHLFHRMANRARVQVPRAFVADDVVEDFDAEMEYAEADTILDMKRKGDGRRYLVRWCISLPCYRVGIALLIQCYVFGCLGGPQE